MKWGFFQPWKSLRVLKTQGEEQLEPTWGEDDETLAVNVLHQSPPDIIHHHHQFNQSSSSSPATIKTYRSNGWLAANLTMDQLTVVTELEPENGQNGAPLADETDSEIVLQRRLSITETLELVVEEPERPYFMPPHEFISPSVVIETETTQSVAPSAAAQSTNRSPPPEVSIDCRKLMTLARRSSDPMTTKEVTATIHRTNQRRPFRTIFSTGYKVDVEPEPRQSYAYSSSDEKNLPKSPIPRQSVVLHSSNAEQERKISESSSDNEFSLSIISSISNNNGGVGAYTVPERIPRTAVMKKGTAAPLALPESSLSSSLVSSDTESARQNVLHDKWRVLFDKFDPEGFGEIPWPDFMAALQTPQFIEAVGPGKVLLLQTLAMSHSMNSAAITYQHFVNIMSGKRSRSFECAVHHRDREISSESDFHLLPMGQKQTGVRRMARLIADEFLTDERDRKYYADHYRCLPPPLFIISVTLIELGFFTYYTVWHGEISSSGPLPMDSPFVYRPDKRQEVWRFLFYMVLHAGWVHLMFNLLVQLLVGLPLEMVHGSLRIGCVYMAGVLAGSLGTSVFDPDVYLVGASGGVYALLAAHLANVLLNYNNMEFGLVRLLGVFLIASVDVGFAIYDRYAASPPQPGAVPPVSYVAHLTGALAGLTIGLLVLKNFEQRLREQLMWWFALGVYAACTLFAILFNVFHPGFPYKY